MKNFKIVSTLCILTMLSTHTTYSIILTGPARRQAHRKQAEEAYQHGLEDGKSKEEFSKENYADDANVSIQSLDMNNSQETQPESAAENTMQLQTLSVEQTPNEQQEVQNIALPEQTTPQDTIKLMTTALPENNEEQKTPPVHVEEKMPSQEQVKIVKVYPVYDALKTGMQYVKKAAHDMFAYVYTLIDSNKA